MTVFSDTDNTCDSTGIMHIGTWLSIESFSVIWVREGSIAQVIVCLPYLVIQTMGNGEMGCSNLLAMDAVPKTLSWAQLHSFPWLRDAYNITRRRNAYNITRTNVLSIFLYCSLSENINSFLLFFFNLRI